MGKLIFQKLGSLLLFLMLAAMLGFLVGCEGDDGTPGADGKSAYEIAVENGYQGTEEQWLSSLESTLVPSSESCGVCHNSIEETHAATDVAVATLIGEPLLINDGAALEFNIDVTVDGVPDDSFTIRRGYLHYDDPDLQTDPPTLITTFVRNQISRPSRTPPGPTTMVSNGDGNYTITVPDGPGDVGGVIYDDGIVDDSNYLFQLESDNYPNADLPVRPVVVAEYGVSPLRELVTNEGCASCHGDFPAWSEKFTHYAVGGSECQICHSQGGLNTQGNPARSTTFNTRLDATTFDEAGPFYGTNLTEYIHGIHNSHHMPDGVYYRTTAPDDDFDEEDRYSIGYPSAIRSCNVCHTSADQLNAAASAPVSYYLCMTCHQNWDGFVDHDGEPIFGEGNFHLTLDIYTNCMSCHGEAASLDEVSDFHDSFEGEDAHYDSFYRGEDISFENHTEVAFTIEGVTVGDAGAASFTWTASDADGAVDPCNTDITAGPTFQDLRAYLAYAKGDDWVNEFVGSSPGQPDGRLQLFPDNTTCAANVATTTGLTLDPDATYALKVVLAVAGKPLEQDTFIVGAVESTESFFVRSPSQTYEFDPADGSAVAARRNAVDTAKCLSCHRGTLYQHGGDRVDNEQLCVICHNPASSDKNNRMDRFMIINEDGTVNTDATYDGLNSQTYDLRYMLHSIHGVGKRDARWVVYRGRGIYNFRTADMDLPPNWPEDGQTIYGSLNDSTITHNDIVVHYPRPVNFCEACHNEEAYEAPDQTKAVALTTDAGTDWPDQSDDRVIGPTAAACTACHFSSPVASHAKGFGYDQVITKDEMLEKAQ